MIAPSIVAFHDTHLASVKTGAPAVVMPDGAFWEFVKANHHFNLSLWDEEDLARRKDVPDAEIAANKRAIDGFNQKRNDAIERLDEILLSELATVVPADNCRLNSETAGSMIDRLSIMSLKIYHMHLQTEREDADAAHIAACAAKLGRLREQRADLAGCLDQLLDACRQGRERFKVYRQFKMYNDPTLNPCLYQATPARG